MDFSQLFSIFETLIQQLIKRYVFVVKNRNFTVKNSLFYTIQSYKAMYQFSICCNKLPQTFWLKATHLFSYSSGGQKSKMVLTQLKSRCVQCCTPSGGSRGQSISWPCPASGGHQHSLAGDAFPHLPSQQNHIFKSLTEFLSPTCII